MEIKDIEKLAKLARIELTEEEKQTYLKDIGAILGYVDQIKEIVTKQINQTDSEESSLRLTEDLITSRVSPAIGLNTAGSLHNVMREDEVGYESGENTEAIVEEFPRKEGNYLKVKKIL